MAMGSHPVVGRGVEGWIRMMVMWYRELLSNDCMSRVCIHDFAPDVGLEKLHVLGDGFLMQITAAYHAAHDQAIIAEMGSIERF